MTCVQCGRFLILSCRDCGNSLLHNISQDLIPRLELIQNTSALIASLQHISALQSASESRRGLQDAVLVCTALLLATSVIYLLNPAPPGSCFQDLSIFLKSPDGRFNHVASIFQSSSSQEEEHSSRLSSDNANPFCFQAQLMTYLLTSL